ncbi:MAG TPA: hypothetical protein VGG35_24445 [Streptosporangiaceae bacterium]|jgi:hypothetical protein
MAAADTETGVHPPARARGPASAGPRGPGRGRLPRLRPAVRRRAELTVLLAPPLAMFAGFVLLPIGLRRL